MSRRKTTEEFIESAISVHGNKYDYSLVEYVNNIDKVKITCKEHGIFKQSPHKHLHKRGCPICGIERRAKIRRLTIKQFIEKVILIHGDTYDYSLVDYKRSCQHVTIVCKKHGAFKQTPNSHLRGNGCNKCAIESRYKTTKDYMFEAQKVHGNKYDYSLVEYKSSKDKIKITCKEHGIFLQRADTHLQRNGCPICTYHISKPERQWLSSIGLPNNKNYRQVPLQMVNGRKRNVDGYDPKTNTVYEFHGDYWHGNPDVFNHNDMNENCKKSFRQLYEDTLIREELIKQSGYNLVVMWEKDWKNGGDGGAQTRNTEF